MSEDYLVIGDIHGRADLLETLLEGIEESECKAHKIVFLGDMVDRGIDSFGVVERVKELCDSGKAIALRGNHEDMMIRYYDSKIPDHNDLWMYNGGKKTAESYCRAMSMYGRAAFFPAFGKSGHAAWMKSLPYYHETPAVFFSHAPIPIAPLRKKEDFRTDVHALTWSWHGNHGVDEGGFAHDHEKLAVCGHVHALREGNLEPRIYDTIIYADTGSGCAPEGRLSAIIITEGRYEGFIQVFDIPKE